MKKNFLFAMCLLTAVSVRAERIDRSSALSIARQFMPGKQFSSDCNISSKHAPRQHGSEPFYVFNAEENGGYVIVSGDDRGPAILGYSAKGNIDVTDIPSNMRWWLENYAQQIASLDASSTLSGLRKSKLAAPAIAPLITTKWNQYGPYNYMCPDKNWVDFDEAGYDSESRCVTGCVATAMAQLMFYWKWPQTCPALDSYQNSSQTKSLHSLPSTAFKWDQMKDTYSYRETGVAADAVAELMRYCGQAVHMQYSPDGSSSSLSARVMANTFQYSPNAREKNREHYTTADWESLIYEELAARRPVAYSGRNDYGGHQFIVDGFDGDGLFHINWGWGGSGDGYYVLSIAEPGGELGAGGTPGAYQYNQYAVLGLKPVEEGEESSYFTVLNYVTEPQEAVSYSRSSSSFDFTDVSFSAVCSVIAWQAVTLEIGWALYQNDVFLQLLKQENNFRHDGGGGQRNRTITNTLSFGAGLANGTYQLCLVYRSSDSEEWQRCENYKMHSFVADISDSSLTFRKAASIMAFDIGELTVSDYPEVEMPVKVSTKVMNTGETERLKFCVWMQVPGSSTWIGGIVHSVYAAPGESADFVFTFRPSEEGEYKLKLTAETSDDALASMTINVAGRDTVVIAGVTYQCTPAYHFARAVNGPTADKSQKEITIEPTVNCNGVVCRVIAIEEAAFLNWYSVKYLSVPEGIERIGDRAFAYMYGLKKLELPSTLKEIGESVIDATEKLESVVSRVAEPFAVSDKTFVNSIWKEQTRSYDYQPSQATLYVPIGSKEKYEALSGWNSFAMIREGELLQAVVGGLKYEYSTGGSIATVVPDESYIQLVDVVIPSEITVDGRTYQVTAIAADAFSRAGSLRSVALPSTLKTIGSDAFYNCGALQNIEVPEGVETIGNYAFAYNRSLIRLVLPNSIRQLGEDLIRGCSSQLAVVSYIAEPFAVSDKTFADRRWNEETSQSDLITSPAILYVPIGTKTLYEAQAGWNWFTDIREGEVLETVIDGIRYSYSTGTSTATVVKDDSYKELATVLIPGEITVDGRTYRVTSVANSAFYKCSQLKTLMLSEGLEVIGPSAFMQSGIGEVILPSTLKEIGGHAFWNCNGIRTLVVPEGVERIGANAFEYMYGLRTLEMPSTLTEIGERVINGTSRLSTVVSHLKEPFAVTDETFANRLSIEGTQDYQLQPSSATLYVPEGCLASYQALRGWQWFADFEEIHETVDDVALPECTPKSVNRTYTLGGTVAGGHSKGLLIVNHRKIFMR